MQKQIIVTGDGSPTLYVPELNEHYHSIFGAIQESEFVYIERGLNFKVHKDPNNIDAHKDPNIFEVGFGIGLNVYLTCLEAETRKQHICFHSIELYPVEEAIWQKLERYFPDNHINHKIFRKIHESKWNEEVEISQYFRLKKINDDMTTYNSSFKYDVIYFDAFGPEVQPELWTAEIFIRIAGMMTPGAVLSTYSSKVLVGRNMKLAGLNVKKLPGPPGKREMIIAIKSGAG
jgi:tRNA U34 5-methylaminomethyl-2-thiouridine-forming methyltransferase MnmC